MKKKFKNPFLINYSILFIFIFFSRFIAYQNLYENNLLEKKNFEFLDQNFLDILLFNNSVPNGHLILHKILNYFDFYNLGIQFNFYLLNIFYSILFLYFLKNTLKNIFKDVYIFPMLLLVSVILIPYETWRPNHHDHINLFIFAYLFWSINNILNNKIYTNHLIFSLILLNLFYSLGFIYTFFIISFLLIINKYKLYPININTLFKFILLFVFIFIIFLKNFISVSIFSSTSMGGANLMQRSIHAIGENKFTHIIESKNINLPSWWLKLSKEIIKKNEIIEDVNVRVSKLAHGNFDKDIRKNFNIQKQLIDSININDPKLIEIINKDIRNFENKPWIYNFGYKQNLLSTKFQSYGSEIFLKSCAMYPYEMFIGKKGNKGFILTAFQMLSYGGLFPTYYEKKKVYWNKAIIKISNFFRIIIIILLCFTPYIFLKVLFSNNLNANKLIYCLMVTFLIFATFITSIITCCENPRMMTMYFFIIIMISNYNIVFLLKKNKFLI